MSLLMLIMYHMAGWEMSEMPTISCGKVMKLQDAPKYEVTIEESPEGGPYKVTTKFLECEDKNE